MVNLGDQLLLNWVNLKSAEQEPRQLELKVDHYTTSKSGISCGHLKAPFIDGSSAVHDNLGQRARVLQGYLLATRIWKSLSVKCIARLVMS